MVQAISLTPCSTAASSNCCKVIAPSAFMTLPIIQGPIPAKFILDMPSFLTPRGIIIPNMLWRKLFLALTFLGFRMALRPQKVKNMVTSSPMEAAPLAIINAAMTLSKSPLNTMIVFLVVSITFPSVVGVWIVDSR